MFSDQGMAEDRKVCRIWWGNVAQWVTSYLRLYPYAPTVGRSSLACPFSASPRRPRCEDEQERMQPTTPSKDQREERAERKDIDQVGV